MRGQDLQRVCEAIGIRPGRTSGNWLSVSCPLSPWTHTGGPNSDNAKGLKMAGGISVKPNGKSKFMCRVCQHTPINLWERRVNFELLRAMVLDEQTNALSDLELAAHELMGKNGEASDEAFYGEIVTKPWPEEFLLNFDPVLSAPEALSYCRVRGIPDEVIEYLGMVWDPRQRRVCWPIRDEEWQLVGLHGRTIDESSWLAPEWEGHPDPETLLLQNPDALVHQDRPPLRYYAYACDSVRNTHVWCNQHLVDMSQPVVVTEGNFDYCRIMAAGYWNVLGSRSSGIHGVMMKYLGKAHHIITYYDRGAGGDAARAHIEKSLGGVGRVIQHIIPNELNDDAGDTPACVIKHNLCQYLLL